MLFYKSGIVNVWNYHLILSANQHSSRLSYGSKNMICLLFCHIFADPKLIIRVFFRNNPTYMTKVPQRHR